ncbi:MAG: sulfatase-like hydrolase/transferase [Thermoanaerobaculia bacterium]|nr:sulfatase-like hydrolase/transferase [Thermoanaerobaculia bacterium]
MILVTLDTTRADFLGCYGRSSARTPTLDALAANGTLFENAYASNPVTQPSHSTILTGTYPMVHGVRDNGMFRLPEARATLAEILLEHGYATGAAVGGFPLTREFGTDQGFEFYDDDLTAGRLDQRGQPGRRQFATWYDERPAGHVNDAILPWLRRQVAETPQQPFFVWLHYWDPHEPHIAPPPFGQLFAHDPYQGEIAYADASLGTFLDAVRDLGELERTLVVVTADHGEGRFEHEEVTHAFLAYDTTLHVPFIVQPPPSEETGQNPRGQRIAERVGTVDLVPTVLDLLGFGVPTDVQGRSLASWIRGEESPRQRDARPYYAESMSPRLSHGFGELRVLFQGPYKFIHGPRSELFRLDQDSDELHDLSEERPDERAALEAKLRGFLDEHASDEAAEAVHEVDDETRRQLAALGYLSTTGESSQTVTEVLRTDGIAPQDRVGDINLLSRLRQALSRGAFLVAQRTAATLVERSPDNAFYRAKLAAAHLGLEQLEEAATVVDETVSFSAANVPDFLAVSRALADAGQTARALQMAKRLVDAEETVGGQLMLGSILRQQGDSAAFEAVMARALELEPEHPAPHLELAEFRLDNGAIAGARQQLEQVLARYPAHTGALLLLARTELAEGEPEAALAHLGRVVSLAPYACEPRLEQMAILSDLGRATEAEQAAEFVDTWCDQETGRRASNESQESRREGAR